MTFPDDDAPAALRHGVLEARRTNRRENKQVRLADAASRLAGRSDRVRQAAVGNKAVELETHAALARIEALETGTQFLAQRRNRRLAKRARIEVETARCCELK